jgi:hypothetical protein
LNLEDGARDVHASVGIRNRRYDVTPSRCLTVAPPLLDVR